MQDFKDVTEMSGEQVTVEQIERLFHRYCWAGSFCYGKDVLEVACGSGPGLGLLNGLSKSFKSGDISSEVLDPARKHYKRRVQIEEFSADKTPFKANSFDIVVIFEAIYYLPRLESFLIESKRILRAGGKLLISMPNSSLSDFNKSPFSHRYYDVDDLRGILRHHGFHSNFYGFLPVETVSFRQRLFRPVKKIAAAFNLIPKTMAGKKFLKRIVFGKLTSMPNEIMPCDCESFSEPEMLSGDGSSHKVIYAEATLEKEHDIRG